MFKGTLICLLAALFFAAFVSGPLATGKQVRGYFGIPAHVGPVPEHVRSAVLRTIPVGSNPQQIIDILRSRGVGTDGNSSCVLSDGERRLTCRVGAQRRAWNIVQEHFLIVFSFGSDRRLSDVEVRSLIEGPTA